MNLTNVGILPTSINKPLNPDPNSIRHTKGPRVYDRTVSAQSSLNARNAQIVAEVEAKNQMDLVVNARETGEASGETRGLIRGRTLAFQEAGDYNTLLAFSQAGNDVVNSLRRRFVDPLDKLSAGLTGAAKATFSSDPRAMELETAKYRYPAEAVTARDIEAVLQNRRASKLSEQ